MKAVTFRINSEKHRRISYAMLDRNISTLQELVEGLLDNWLENPAGINVSAPSPRETPAISALTDRAKSGSLSVTEALSARGEAIGDEAAALWLEVLWLIIKSGKRDAINMTTRLLEFVYEHVVREKRNHHRYESNADAPPDKQDHLDHRRERRKIA
jgi:hypothetical protein